KPRPAPERAKTEMESKRYVGWNFLGQTINRRHVGCDLALGAITLTIDGRDLPGAVPLDGQILKWNRIEDGVEFSRDRRLVSGSNFLDISRNGKRHRPDHAVDHRHGDLEPHSGRQHPLRTQSFQNKVGVHRVLGVAEAIAWITKTNAVNSVPHLELPGIVATARHQLLNTVRAQGALGGVKIDMSVEHLVGQPHDPG